jgi:iron complex transport system substrate-binding protein
MSSLLRQFPPSRIVCLTEETVETLYLLGEQDRIVGVSGYAVRPPQVRREKPRVSAFTSADTPKIRALEPDLVLAVHAFNQRDIAGILAMIRTIGALVGAQVAAEALAQSYEARLNKVAASIRGRPKPKVYFEEWDDPLVSGIGWVSELIEIAGGEDVFPELRKQKAAKDRLVSPHDVIAAAPDVIVVVRQEGRSGQDPTTIRMGCDPGSKQLPHRRDQVGANPAAWTCGPDGRPRRNPRRTGTWEMTGELALYLL